MSAKVPDLTTDRLLPHSAGAMIEALRFQDPDFEPLRSLSERQWDRLLEFADRVRLTLLLHHRCGACLPARIHHRIERDLERNSKRLSRLRSALVEIVSSLEAAGLEYALLKGFAHRADFMPGPDLRLHYDIDLYCPSGLEAARDKILGLGYEPLAEMEDFPTDHLPVMVRKTGWHWRGDIFDPDIPPSVDLHFRLWDENTERFSAPGLPDFWERRVRRELDGRPVTTFSDTDLLGYAALHLLRHLLRGSAGVQHVYEIAHFLDRRAADAEFWSRWTRLHPPKLRRLEATTFELARLWFHCRLPAEARLEIRALPAAVRRWMDQYGFAPLEALFRPNKSEIWLHLCLVDSPGGKWPVLRRRMLPLRLPAPIDPPSASTGRLLRRLRYWSHVVRRLGHHIRVLPRLGFEAVGWYFAKNTAARRFLLFLIAANTFSFGVFIFVLLYNLLLLDLGFREDFLGIVNGAMILGSMAGALAMPVVARPFGLKKTLVLGSALTPTIFALRAYASSPEAVLASGLAGGAALSIWMTSLSPTVASLTDERSRPAGFSWWIGTGIATGIAGAFLGSRLPAWLTSAGVAHTASGAKVAAILCGCGVSLLSLTPLSRLPIDDSGGREPRLYPRSRFVMNYLLAFAIWSFAIGAFNPFFNAYFARQFGAAVEQIGGIYSAAQGVQALGIAAAPLLLRKMGLPRGTALLQLAAALALASMAAAPVVSLAAVLYACFMTFQVMCEPGIFSLLMDRVKPAERVGASGLNSLTMFGAQALAATGAGWAFVHFGYPATLSAAAGLALLSAWLFRRLA